jgi:hypothetical protein
MLPQPQYRDTERAYQRVVAGIGWPSAKPGAICIVGEEASYRAPNLYLLDEVEESDPGEFFRVCLDLEGKFKVSGFYSRLDEVNLEYLSMWNKQRRESRLSTLSISGAPFSDDGRLQYHLSIAKDKLRVEQKSLHLGEARVAGLLTEILTSELADIKDVDNPLIAALAYAVAALVTWKYVEPVPEPDSGDYNPLTYGLGPGE